MSQSTRRRSIGFVAVLGLLSAVSLSGCGDGDGSVTAPIAAYALRATVNGLNSPGLMLKVAWNSAASYRRSLHPVPVVAVASNTFAGGNDGAHPYGNVTQGADGSLYTTTYQGGASGYGTVIKIASDNTETVLYSFQGSSSDGAYPEAGLTLGSNGNLYGATYQGGVSGLGTVFQITPSGVETTLHSFAGGSADGANDWANLVLGIDGNLYGSSYAGGTSGLGTFFQLRLQ